MLEWKVGERERERERGREERERGREGERERGRELVSVTVCGLEGQESPWIYPTCGVFLRVFSLAGPSPRVLK